MGKKRLIGLDMDGTVLTDNKEILPEVEEAIHRALAAGAEVVFCTGRSLAEMRETIALFPDMRYHCLESGAFLYDAWKGEPLRTENVPMEVREALAAAARGRDILPQVFASGEAYMNAAQMRDCSHYLIEAFQPLYDRVVTPVEDALAFALDAGRNVEKINLFHTGPAEREKTARMVMGKGLPAEFAYCDESSLEASPEGLTKARGLEGLCGALGITLQEAAMVGDADNDLAAMEAVGYAVAMGNANERVKAAADCSVADNEHGGCAEALGRILEHWGLRAGEQE